MISLRFHQVSPRKLKACFFCLFFFSLSFSLTLISPLQQHFSDSRPRSTGPSRSDQGKSDRVHTQKFWAILISKLGRILRPWNNTDDGNDNIDKINSKYNYNNEHNTGIINIIKEGQCDANQNYTKSSSNNNDNKIVATIMTMELWPYWWWRKKDNNTDNNKDQSY